jgi:hypothetical protein
MGFESNPILSPLLVSVDPPVTGIVSFIPAWCGTFAAFSTTADDEPFLRPETHFKRLVSGRIHA